MPDAVVKPLDGAAVNGAASERHDVVEYGVRRIAITIAVVLGSLLEIVDTTIVNVALPYIQGNVGASRDEGAFIVTGYIVANVIVIPLSPYFQRRFGRRQYFAASIIIFTFASLMCGLSRDLWPLVFWRVVQGAGGGGLLSQGQAILRETFPKEMQGVAQGVFAVGALFGPSIGPLLGGLIVDNASWPWIFFVNIPLGIGAAVLTLLFMKNPEDPRAVPLDTIGVALLSVGLGSLQYVLDQGQEKDWFSDSLIVDLSTTAAIALVAFVFWELYGARSPAVDLRVLRNRTLAAGSLLGFVLGITLLGTLITLPQLVQGSLNFTATLAGLLLTLRAIPVMLLTPVGVVLATRVKVDPRLQIGAGFLLIGISNLLLANVTTIGSPFSVFIVSLVLSGIGLSQVFVPLSLVVFGSVAPPDVPKASALFNLSRQLGGSVATAVLITLLTRSEVVHQSRLAEAVNLSRTPVSAFVTARGIVSPTAATQIAGVVEAQSLVLAYADVSRFVGYVTIGLAPLSLLLTKPKGESTEVEA